MSERRVFVTCKEHGRQVAYVYTRGDRPPRADGRPRRLRKCRLCQRLASRAWYHYGGGRDKIAVSSARYKAANADKVREQGVAYRAANVRWDRPRKVATVALVLTWCIISAGWLKGLDRRSGEFREDVRVQSPGPGSILKKSKPNPFDPCRWSPFFCGYIRGAR